jgi:site-specific DNA-methyltransferase (adenine-specific)
VTAIVTVGDAADLHLPDATVDLVVTSPPYWSLRSYTDGGRHYPGQVGDEPAPHLYLQRLWDCTREWMRVLKPGGSIFVVLGDKYADEATEGRIERAVVDTRTGAAVEGKSLLMLPQRYAIGCVDRLGLIARAEIIWAKPNGLPESVTDRVRRAHEQVFHFVKQPRYFAAVDEVREPYTPAPPGKHDPGQWNGAKWKSQDDGTHDLTVRRAPNPLGKLPGSVWSIPTSPLRVPAELGIDHFAAYPPELVRRIVLGWSPREVCSACGEGRCPVSKRGVVSDDRTRIDVGAEGRTRRLGATSSLRSNARGGEYPPVTITGYACACPDTTAPATPGIVLDPFGGTGTTALVASVHGRVGITVDLSADYCRLAQWRTTDPQQRERVA